MREGAGTERGPHLRRLNQQQLSELRAQVDDLQKALQEQDYIFGDYIERLWAYLTIEQLLEKR